MTVTFFPKQDKITESVDNYVSWPLQNLLHNIILNPENVNNVDDFGNTLLHYLFMNPEIYNFKNVLQMLLNNPKIDFTIPNRDGNTVLHLYIRQPLNTFNYHLEYNERALECIDIPNNRGETPRNKLIHIMFEDYEGVENIIFNFLYSKKLLNSSRIQGICEMISDIITEKLDLDVIIYPYENFIYKIKELMIQSQQKRINEVKKIFNKTCLYNDVVGIIFEFI